MSQITVLTGPERRRRWHSEDKMRILAEAFSPGACVTEVARRHDVSTGLIYSWRARLRRELPQPGFAEAVLADEPRQAPELSPVIVIDLPGSGRVSLAASAPAALAAAVLKALR